MRKTLWALLLLTGCADATAPTRTPDLLPQRTTPDTAVAGDTTVVFFGNVCTIYIDWDRRYYWEVCPYPYGAIP